MMPSPVVRLNRAVALRYVAGPEAALAEVDNLAGDLADYHLFHAIRGELLLELGRREQARAAELRALALTENTAERSLLQYRLGNLQTPEDGLIFMESGHPGQGSRKS